MEDREAHGAARDVGGDQRAAEEGDQPRQPDAVGADVDAKPERQQQGGGGEEAEAEERGLTEVLGRQGDMDPGAEGAGDEQALRQCASEGSGRPVAGRSGVANGFHVSLASAASRCLPVPTVTSEMSRSSTPVDPGDAGDA